MDASRIAAIERFVNAQRAALRKDVETQLHGYGIQSSGELLPESSLDHLPDEERRVADQLRSRLEHLKARMKAKEAVESLTREQAFTSLNRIVALRMAEARGIVPACVSAGMESEGFAVYRQCVGSAKVAAFDWYREYLFALFDELSVELPALFDRFRGEGLVFPSEGTLRALLDAMRASDIVEAWTEDETIGWIFQYFNDSNERKKLREKPAPTDSYELAVRNQFFTPRFVVRFLVDNSLGRLWCEMTQDRGALKEQCGMLALAPSDSLGKVAAKEPRELRVIDPACGSMHFGLYTFDVLVALYRDAWERKGYAPAAALRKDYPELVALEREIPRLICEQNIFGVDIDSRAVQISGITLWLRAHRAWQELGSAAAERPRIRRFNLATAQPMPGEKEFREEFLGTLSPPALQKLAGVVWDELKLAGEVGSLLKVDTALSRHIDSLRKAWEKMPQRDQKQEWLGLAGDDKEAFAKRRYGVDLSLIHEEDDWSEMEAKVFDSLAAFAGLRRSGAGAYQRSLFADDTQAGFAFLDVLRRSFDVVLMNPPFGASATGSKKYIEDNYPRSKNDLYSAFVESFLDRLVPGGYLAAITSRTGLFLSTFTTWREEVLLGNKAEVPPGVVEPVVLADLGSGVLDAMVETAAYVLRAQGERLGRTTFFRLLKETAKAQALLEFVQAYRTALDDKHIFLVEPEKFAEIPNSPFAYWVDDEIRDLFAQFPPFESDERTVRVGLQTGDDFRFLRAWWEIPADRRLDAGNGPCWREDLPAFQAWCRKRTSENKYWVPYAKGGEYSPYYADIHLVVNWKNDGLEIRNFTDPNTGKTYSRPQNTDYYFRPGVTWPKVTISGLSMRPFHAGQIFSVGGLACFSRLEPELSYWLVATNTGIYELLMRLMGAWHNWEVGQMKTLPFSISNGGCEKCNTLARELVTQVSEYKRDDSTSNLYFSARIDDIQPTIQDLQKIKDKMKAAEDHILADHFSSQRFEYKRIQEILKDDSRFEWTHTEKNSEEIASSEIERGIGIALGRYDIRIAKDPKLAARYPNPFDPLPVSSPAMLQGVDGLSARADNIASESWLLARPSASCLPPEPALSSKISAKDYLLDIPWDGILVDDPDDSRDIIMRFRTVLADMFGDEAECKELEYCSATNNGELRDYIRKPNGFFDSHLMRYSKSRRKAPIFWPLSTIGGGFTVWVYYPRLTDATLYAVHDIARKKAELMALELTELSGLKVKSTKQQQRFDLLTRDVGEVRQFAEEVLRIANLPYKPDLDDGVPICAAPLHSFFRHSGWSKYLKETWEELEAGKYDWAHLAYAIWPERVRDKARTDRSLAIAHGLESRP